MHRYYRRGDLLLWTLGESERLWTVQNGPPKGTEHSLCPTHSVDNLAPLLGIVFPTYMIQTGGKG